MNRLKISQEKNKSLFVQMYHRTMCWLSSDDDNPGYVNDYTKLGHILNGTLPFWDILETVEYSYLTTNCFGRKLKVKINPHLSGANGTASSDGIKRTDFKPPWNDKNIGVAVIDAAISEKLYLYQNPLTIHADITCDSCNGTPVGMRYECCFCRDFDLCEKCYKENAPHDVCNNGKVRHGFRIWYHKQSPAWIAAEQRESQKKIHGLLVY